MKFSKSLLCLALALSLLAGCAGAFAEESGFPLVSEPITFTAFTAWVEMCIRDRRNGAGSGAREARGRI